MRAELCVNPQPEADQLSGEPGRPGPQRPQADTLQGPAQPGFTASQKEALSEPWAAEALRALHWGRSHRQQTLHTPEGTQDGSVPSKCADTWQEVRPPGDLERRVHGRPDPHHTGRS